MGGFVWKGFLVAAAAAVLVSVAPLFLTMSSTETEIFGVKIVRNPPQSKLTQLGVSSWRTWEGGPSKFPWTFTATETMYFLEGKVKVECDGHEGEFEIGAGDLVVFPKGMKVTWDITEAVKKHFSLDVTDK
uniref:(S)-ureidoglycine aminohydrolase cupin domain-containing protein n=1 Tax=Kalanchoe fedtschenkoi TaxID=63787 RepID=A0A7N0VAB6_KALFE